MNLLADNSPAFFPIMALIYLVLHLFGWLYNILIDMAERRGYLEGHTGYAVALGVTVTLAPFVFFETVRIWWIFMAFVASGSPMLIGAWWRHVSARHADQQQLRES